MKSVAASFLTAWSVSLSLLITLASCAKTPKLIEMPFGEVTRMGPSNHILDWFQIPQGKMHFYRSTSLGQWTHVTLRQVVATSSTQQGRLIMAVRAVATITVATCYDLVCILVSLVSAKGSVCCLLVNVVMLQDGELASSHAVALWICRAYMYVVWRSTQQVTLIHAAADSQSQVFDVKLIPRHHVYTVHYLQDSVLYY